MPREGEPATEFSLPNQDGEEISLSDFAGRWLVVYFYPRADTPGCTTEACEIRDDWDRFTDRDIGVVGISDDPVTDLKAFAEKFDLPFDLLSDETGEVSAAYDSYKEKTAYGNTFMGVVRNTYVVDPEGDIAAVYEDVTPEGHAEELLSEIPAEA